MFVELCLVVRIVLNGSDHVLLKNVSIRPCAVTDSSWSQSQTTREPQKTTVATQNEHSILGTQDGNANLKSLWIYKPVTHEALSPSVYDSLPVVFRAPHLVTKLAKSFAYGLEPYFSKGYFEPFERRPKPVTLVGFRRNGMIPRKTVKSSGQKSSDVAELQSKFNDISNFWIDAAPINLA